MAFLQQIAANGGGSVAPAPKRRRSTFVGLPDSAIGPSSKKKGGGFDFGDILGGLGNTLGTPLAAVTSTIKEVGDAIGGNKEGTPLYGQHASLGDWWDQVYHPDKRLYGSDLLFGNKEKGIGDTAIGDKIKNPLQRAALGFGADVAVDPLTFVTGAGKAGSEVAEHIVQQGSKQAAVLAAEQGSKLSAKEIAELLAKDGGPGQLIEHFGSTTEAAQKLQRTGEAAAKARRTGATHLTRNEIAEFLTDESGKVFAERGLKFAGKKIVGSDRGPLAKAGELFASGKAGLADKTIAGPIGKMFQGDRELLQAARSGKGEKAFEAIWTKMAKDTAEGVERSLAGGWAKRLVKDTKGMKDEDWRTMERALSGDPKAQEQLGELHTKVRSLLDEIHGTLVERGAKINKTLDYAPRELSAEGRRVLASSGMLSADGSLSPFASFEKARTLVPNDEGMYSFMGKEFAAANNAEVLDHVNRIAKEALHKVDPKAAAEMEAFFNPKFNEAMAHYIGNAAKRVSQMDAAGQLYDAGVHVPLGIKPREFADVPKPKALGPGAEAPVAADFVAGYEKGAVAADAVRSTMRELADKVDNFQASAKELETALGSGDGHTAFDAFSHAIEDAIGLDPTDAEGLKRLQRVVADHFHAGPGGVPVGDVEKIKGTLQGIAKNMRAHAKELGDDLAAAERVQGESFVAKLAGPAAATEAGAPITATRKFATQAAASQDKRAYNLLHETPQATQGRIEAIQNEVAAVRQSLDSGAVKLTPSQQRDLDEYLVARAEQLDVAQARLGATDPSVQRALAFDETAAEMRASLARDGKGLADESIKWGNIDERHLTAMSDAIRRGVAMEIKAGLATPQNIADMLLHADKLRDPEALRTVFKTYDKVVGYIKSWQIATPGFHVRNFMGGVYNNFLAGVNAHSYDEFARVWARAARNPEGVDAKLLERFNTVERLLGRVSGQVGSEGRRGGDYIRELGGNAKMSFNPLSRNGFWVKGSQATGEEVEFMLRGTLAWDVLKKGGSVHDVVAKVNKFHFNYNDLSSFEQGVRRVMPFYTWTRKNLPLQIEMMQKNPKVYARFAHAKAEIENQSEADPIKPGYFKDLMAVRLPWMQGGGHVYWTPDLPARDLQRLNDPLSEGLGMLTPVIKTPVEWWAHKQTFKDLPLSDKKFVPLPLPALVIDRGIGPALVALGRAQKQDGHYFMTERDAYALEQFVPILGRYRRLLPKEEKYKERQWTSVFSLFGFGSRTNTLKEQDKVTTGDEFRQKDSATRRKALEKAAAALRTDG